MIAYTRFNISSKGILWVELDEGFSPSIINFFVNRYPLFYIMLGCRGKTFVKKKGKHLAVFNKPVKEVVKLYETELKEVPLLKDLTGDCEKLWSEFYDSQYIKQRKNHRLFHHWIPKSLKKVKGLKKEFNALRSCERITKFIKQE
jgi:hypothetical protein